MGSVEPEDHIAILELLSRYSRCFDSGDVEGFAKLFTEDASFETPVGNAASRVEIETWARERWGELRRDQITPTHFQTNTLLRRDAADRASGTTQLLLIWHHGKTNKSELTGTAIYEDEFCKTADGWRIARRAIGWNSAPQEEA